MAHSHSQPTRERCVSAFVDPALRRALELSAREHGGRCRASFGSFSGPAAAARSPSDAGAPSGPASEGKRRRERRLGDRLLCGTAARGARPVRARRDPRSCALGRSITSLAFVAVASRSSGRRRTDTGVGSPYPRPRQAAASGAFVRCRARRRPPAGSGGALRCLRPHVGQRGPRAIRSEIGAASPLKVETGGFLFAHQRRLFFADICHASGPAPNFPYGRTSVMVGEVLASLPSSASSPSEPT